VFDLSYPGRCGDPPFIGIMTAPGSLACDGGGGNRVPTGISENSGETGLL
jgi:hypothetical protein